MRGFLLTRAAKNDLKQIGRHTQKTWGVAQRNRYLTLLDESFHKLCDNPQLGRDCQAIRPGYRKCPVGKHMVFYRILETDEIEIVRILHERMDVEMRLADS